MRYWHGRKVQLRALETSDAEFLFSLSQDAQRTQLLDWLSPPKSRLEVDAWLKKKAERGMEDFAFQWMIENLRGDTVGSIGTHSCDARVGAFSYGVEIAQEHQRRGYGSEAVTLVLRYYFEELRFQKATVACHSDNQPSIAMHRQLGFEHEGSHRRVVFKNGGFFDLEWLGITAEEFLRRHQQASGDQEE